MRRGFIGFSTGMLIVLTVLSGCTGAQKTLARPDMPPQLPTATEQPDWHPAMAKINHLALARHLVDQGHYPVAMRQLRDAIQETNDDPEPHYLLGVCQRETGDLTAARQSFEQAIRLDRDHAPAYNGLGITCFLMNRTVEAHGALSQATALDPANSDFQNNLGILEMRQNHLNAARSRFEQSLHLFPDQPRVVNNLAECLVRLGRDTDALTVLNRHYPPATACNNLGSVYLVIGRPEPALEMYRRALIQDPELDAARRNLNRITTEEITP